MTISVQLSICLLFLALIAIGVTPTMDTTGRFSPITLKTHKDCVEFARQKKFRITTCDAYYQKQEFFLDDRYKHSLPKCAKEMAKITDGSIPAILYNIQGIENYTDDHRKTMRDMHTEVVNYVDLVPQVRFYIGPRGNDSMVAKGLVKLYSHVALAVAEEESLTMAYKQEFFDSLNRSMILENSNTQFLVLNGWHLRNMDKPPKLRPDFNMVYAGVVIWVKPSHAHLIGQNEARRFLNGTYMPIVYNMPGSPEHNGAPTLQVASVFLWLVLGSFLSGGQG